MLLLRWILVLVVFQQKYARATSIAEEINFEVSNMRDSTKNDPQVYIVQDPMEPEPEEAAKEEAEDVETAQSEIIETHVSPEDGNPEEMNAQAKRPRRRRRRRRRKRPKPTASPDELDTYYATPEEEIKRKPIKYRPQEENEEPAPDSSTLPRRRNVKRRRRPLKRPIVEDYPATAEGSAENANNTEENLSPELLKVNQPEEEPNKKPETVDAPSLESQLTKLPLLPITARKMQSKKDNEPLHTLSKDNTKIYSLKEYESPRPPPREENRKPQHLVNQEDHDGVEYPKFDSINTKLKNREISLTTGEVHKENDTQKEEQGANGRRRKRPSLKEQADPSKLELEPKVAESVDTKNQVQTIRKNEVKLDDEVKINLVEQRKLKIDERVKQNDTSKKDVFKLRRLPPISAILRHAKNRPKNETSAKPTPKNESSKIKESITNEILTHAATLNHLNHRSANETDEDEPQHIVTSTAHTEKLASLSTPTSKLYEKENHFEFPIITYTEQKQKFTTTSTAQTSTAVVNTTENTAFIYVPCNQTTTEKSQNNSNSSGQNVSKNNELEKTIPEAAFIENQTATQEGHHENESVFETSAIKQLEKLLQAEMETVSATIETINQTTPKNVTKVGTLLQHLDASALESELNYLFQKGVTAGTTNKDVKSSTEMNFREPKWYQDSSKYRPLQSNNDQIPQLQKENTNYNNKEIIISYTSTIPPITFNEVDPQELFHGNELTLHLRNNSYRRMLPDNNILHKNKNHNERKKLPLAVKSAIIISGAILALAVLGFFALLLSCKIRQTKSRMKCHRELYRERFQNSEFRQSSRSTSPVVSKSNYNTRNFPNNIQTNVASNRNYYLWQTLRKTFQYD